MRSSLRLCVAVLAGAAAISITPVPVLAAGNVGSFVVVLRDGTSPDQVASAARSRGAEIGFVYRDALSGFSAELTEGALAALRRNRDVVSISPDADVVPTGTVQPAPPPHLDRVDQRAPGGDGKYAYTESGSTVRAYVVDSGIRATHVEFGGRVVATQDLTGGSGADCDNHGTAVASLLGGTTFGTAKLVDLVNVRVYASCSGVTTVATLIAGVNWVVADHVLGDDAVANIGLSQPGGSAALDAAVSGAIADGITVTTGAGNGNVDACTSSPGSVAGAITVGAADPVTDTRWTNSNWGSCVDLFAPGVNNVVAETGSDVSTTTATESSFASPLVAGVAALYLQQNPGAAPADVEAAIKGAATQGVIVNAASGTNDDMLHQNTYAVSTVYCDAGHVSGSITYNAAASSTTVPVNLSWSFNLNLDCANPPLTNGQPLAFGVFNVTANGTSSDTCANGTGAGTVTGGSKTAGPEQGTILPGGTWQYRRAGIHYYGYPPNGDGNFTLRDPLGWHRKYRMYLWLDYVPTTSNHCPKAGVNALIGHAQFSTE